MKTSPFQFIQEVRTELRKITWPNRQEVWVTSLMVFIMSALMALFFMGIDWVFGFGIKSLLELGQ